MPVYFVSVLVFKKNVLHHNYLFSGSPPSKKTRIKNGFDDRIRTHDNRPLEDLIIDCFWKECRNINPKLPKEPDDEIVDEAFENAPYCHDDCQIFISVAEDGLKYIDHLNDPKAKRPSTPREKIADHFAAKPENVRFGKGFDDRKRPRSGWFVKIESQEYYLGRSFHEVQSSANWANNTLY